VVGNKLDRDLLWVPVKLSLRDLTHCDLSIFLDCISAASYGFGGWAQYFGRSAVLLMKPF
jgi:hypothetical protein